MTRTTPRWINTRLEYDPTGKLVHIEGYWYRGPISHAGAVATRGEDWAFYNDDGSESGATIIGTQNVNPTKGTIPNDTPFAFRMGVEETNGGAWNNAAPALQFNYQGAGLVAVTTTSSPIKAVALAHASAPADGDSTTQRITGATIAAFKAVNDGVSFDGIAGGANADFDADVNDGAEMLWGLQIDSTLVSDNDTIVLHVQESSGTDLDAYAQTDPTITVAKVAGTDYVEVKNETSQVSSGRVQASQLNRLAGETLQASEARQAVMQLLRVADETVQSTEVTALASSLLRLLSETANLNEDAQFTRGMSRVLDETVQASEGIVDLLSAALLAIIDETAGLPEAQQQAMALARILDETVQAGEVVSQARQFALTSGESISLAEGALVSLMLARIVSETVQLSEAIDDVLGAGAGTDFVEVLNEILNNPEALAQALQLARIQDETIGTGEALTLLRQLLVVLDETT